MNKKKYNINKKKKKKKKNNKNKNKNKMNLKSIMKVPYLHPEMEHSNKKRSKAFEKKCNFS